MTRLKEMRVENRTKRKCLLSEKKCLIYERGQKRPSSLLYFISQKFNQETTRRALADCTGLRALANNALRDKALPLLVIGWLATSNGTPRRY